MKAKIAITTALMIVLSGCTPANSDTTDKGADAPPGQAPAKVIVVVDYEGRDIFCVEQWVGNSNNAYSCDLATWNHGESVKAPKGMKRVSLTVIQMPYRGKMLKCLTFRLHKGHPGYNCDYQRFYKENPDELPPPEQPK